MQITATNPEVNETRSLFSACLNTVMETGTGGSMFKSEGI